MLIKGNIFSILETTVLIQSGTCEENGMTIPADIKDCQEKAKAVGIFDNKVLNYQSEVQVCGCRAFTHKSSLALQWNDPNGKCSPATKCTKESKCVCLSKGKKENVVIWGEDML